MIVPVKMKIIRVILMLMLMMMPAVAKDLSEVEFVAGLHVGPHARHLLDHHLHLEVNNLTQINPGSKNLHREVFKLWRRLDDPGEGGVAQLGGEVEPDVFRLPVEV